MLGTQNFESIASAMPELTAVGDQILAEYQVEGTSLPFGTELFIDVERSRDIGGKACAQLFTSPYDTIGDE